jgi:hypothetical protein
LLRFLVEQTLDGHGDGLKESVIAAEIYGDSDYDSKRQAIVRSEIRRLRLSLLEIYSNCDATSPIRIEIPKGSYRPDFVPTIRPASDVLSTAVYIPPTVIGMLKGAAFGYKGELFAAAYKEHDPTLVWCRYLGRTAGSDLPEVIRKMGLQ